jgi:hypothetical protein
MGFIAIHYLGKHVLIYTISDNDIKVSLFIEKLTLIKIHFNELTSFGVYTAFKALSRVAINLRYSIWKKPIFLKTSTFYKFEILISPEDASVFLEKMMWVLRDRNIDFFKNTNAAENEEWIVRKKT